MRQPLDHILSTAQQPGNALARPERSVLGFSMRRNGHLGAGALLSVLAFALAMSATSGGSPALILPGLLLGFLSLPFFGAAVALTTPVAPADGIAPVDRVRADHLRAALQRNGGKPTVEQIAAYLRWTVPAVAAGLRVLVDARELIEDVDLDTGEYIYYLTSALTEQALGDDLERRIAEAARAAGLSFEDLSGAPGPMPMPAAEHEWATRQKAAELHHEVSARGR